MDYPTIFDGSMKQPKYPSNVIDIIFEGSNQLGIALSENSLAGMAQHMELLAQWGKRINLTSLRDPVEIAVLHFIDSLTVFKVLPFASGMRILDIGTGAGFPGMVMKTADSSLKLTLLDRDTKKVVFLKHLAHKLGLTGITFLNMPLEVVLGKQGFHGFDAAISRAVSSDPDFMDSLCCLLQPTGFLIKMSGPASLEESPFLRNFTLQAAWEGSLPFLHKFRRVHLYSRKDLTCTGIP
jgi:16S rRNA (guanine527-N7)-methyltransferase